MLTNPSSTYLPSYTPAKYFSSQNRSCFNWPGIMTSPKKPRFLDNDKMCPITDITHLFWFRLYIRENYIFRNLLLFYASIHLFIYRYENFFYYIYIIINFCVAEITHTTRCCISVTGRTWKDVQSIAAAL